MKFKIIQTRTIWTNFYSKYLLCPTQTILILGTLGMQPFYHKHLVSLPEGFLRLLEAAVFIWARLRG